MNQQIFLFPPVGAPLRQAENNHQDENHDNNGRNSRHKISPLFESAVLQVPETTLGDSAETVCLILYAYGTNRRISAPGTAGKAKTAAHKHNRHLFLLLNGENGSKRRAHGYCRAARGGGMFVPRCARFPEINARRHVGVNSDVTDGERSCHSLVPAVVEQHRTHVFFINVAHCFSLGSLLSEPRDREKATRPNTILRRISRFLPDCRISFR